MVLISQILFTAGLLIGFWMGRTGRYIQPKEIGRRRRTDTRVIRTPQVELYFNERK